MDIGKLGKIFVLLQNDHFQCYSLKNSYIVDIEVLSLSKIKIIAPLQKTDKEVTLLQFYLLSAE